MRRLVVGIALVFAACSQVATERPDSPGGYRDLEVPTRWGDYPLAGALARMEGRAGLDWVDHLTNCGLSGEWIEEMRAAWWSEREYTISSVLEAQLRMPFGGFGRLEQRAETMRIRYGSIGGETTAENGLRREVAALREQVLELCPLIDDPDIYWIQEAIFADEVTITLETAAGDTLTAEILEGMVGIPAHWTVSDAGVMRSDERVYVAFRNATPAEGLLEPDAVGRYRGIGDLAFVPLGLRSERR